MWQDGLDSGVNSLFVSELFPKNGQEFTVSVSIPDETGVEDVGLFSFQNDWLTRFPCRKEEGMYRCPLVMSPGGVWYCFIIKAEGKFWFLSDRGVTASIPSYRDFFHICHNETPASWVASSNCYQIFPDRYAKGDAHVGAREGEYSYDGGSVSVHNFHEKPLPFSQGRCLDFFNGDLKGIEKRLPYLKGLGFDTIYLNPIGVSMTTHRYDCDDFFHVDPKLGGDDAFVSLCDAVHKEGMRIIVDISINHTGSVHPWLKEKKGYYYIGKDGKPDCWQGVPTLPQLNYGSESLRDEMYRGKESVMRKFLRPPFLQDGWRLDVANEVGKHGSDDFCHEVWRQVNKAVKEENPHAYLVGEDWCDSSAFLQGDQWDGTMNYYGCSRPLRTWMGECDRYLSDGWGTMPEACTPYTGNELADAIEEALHAIPSQMRFLAFNLLDSHDTPRLCEKGKADFDLYRGVVMMQYLLPGMPSTYYGDEVGLPGPYGTLEDARYPMQWDEKKWDMRFVDLYREMGSIRNRYRTLLSFGAWRFVGSDRETVAFARYDGKDALVAVLNRSEAAKELTIDNSRMRMRSDRNGRVSFSGKQITIRLKAKENLILELSSL